MNIDFNLSHEEEQELSKELSDKVNNALKKAIKIDDLQIGTRHINEVVKESLKKVLIDKLEPSIKRILDKFETEIQLLKTHLIQENMKFAEVYMSSNDLSNVRISFITVRVPFKYSSDALGKLYFESKGYTIFRFSEFCRLSSNTLSKVIDSFEGFDEFNRCPERKGAPDFALIKNARLIFSEVKTGDDGLKVDQFRWFKNHPMLPIRVIYFDQIIDDKIKNPSFLENPEAEE